MVESGYGQVPCAPPLAKTKQSLIFTHSVLRFVPASCSEAMITIAIKAAINPYSMAVTPS